MHPHLAWLADVAASPKITNAAARLAVAIASSVDDRGRYRGMALPLAVAAQQSSRHQKDLLDALVKEGFLRLHRHKNGRMDIEIIAPHDDAAPASEKPFREIVGEVVGVMPKGKTAVAAYLESDTAMVKLTIPRNGAEAIAAALAPVGAQGTPAAVG